MHCQEKMKADNKTMGKIKPQEHLIRTHKHKHKHVILQVAKDIKEKDALTKNIAWNVSLQKVQSRSMQKHY